MHHKPLSLCEVCVEAAPGEGQRTGKAHPGGDRPGERPRTVARWEETLRRERRLPVWWKRRRVSSPKKNPPGSWPRGLHPSSLHPSRYRRHCLVPPPSTIRQVFWLTDLSTLRAFPDYASGLCGFRPRLQRRDRSRVPRDSLLRFSAPDR